ncbi:ABC transporter substrate-binding protein [Paenibacillus turpanensis]|uniref:ABC transporter substrate-binding protein n=1 Tax=Paenibacillus turpanensis TaxID=2689078 RepID=UPI001408A20B|nr:ABC transporter substrate-binding protein [Paenibacillus turpanensis]
MIIERHYLRLLHAFGTEEAQGGKPSVLVTTDQLAEVLDCTRRNVALILRRLEEEDWVQWEAQRGRGKRSRLVLKCSLQAWFARAARAALQRRQRLEDVLRGSGWDELMKRQRPGAIDALPALVDNLFGESIAYEQTRRVDTMRFPLRQPLYSLDPIHTTFAVESHIVRQLYDGLVTYNRMTGLDAPALAHAWECSPDGTVWTFYLRKGVLFHHGKEMDAEDVVFSLQRLLASGGAGLHQWVYRQMVHVEAADPFTVKIRLKEKNGFFLPFLGTSRASIVPMDLVSSDPERLRLHPVGTGAYRFNADHSEVYVLEAFARHYAGRAHLDRIELWNVSGWFANGITPEEKDAELESFPVLHHLAATDAGAGGKASQRHTVHVGTSCKFITVNTKKPGPLQCGDTRLALLRLLAPEAVVRGLAAAQGPATGELLAGGSFLTEDSAAEKIESGVLEDSNHVSSQAQKQPPLAPSPELQERPLRLITIPSYAHDAAAVQAAAEQAGLSLTVELLTPEQFRGPQRLEADLLLFGIMLDNDAELRLADLYHTMRGHMEPGVAEAAHSLLTELAGAEDAAVRLELLRAIERELTTAGVLHVLYRRRLHVAFHPSIGGIDDRTAGWVSFKELWLRPQNDKRA